MNELKNQAGLSPEAAPGHQSGPESQPEQKAEAQARPGRALAHIVIGLLYLSFILHVANSEAVTGFVAEARRLLEKFMF